jgi:hypothetical protein
MDWWQRLPELMGLSPLPADDLPLEPAFRLVEAG